MRNQRTVLVLVLGLIIAVVVVIAASSAGARQAFEGSEVTGSQREGVPSSLTPEPTGSLVIDITVEEGGDPPVKEFGAPGKGSTISQSQDPTSSPPPSADGSVPATSAPEDNQSSTVMPRATDNGRNTPTPIVTPTTAATSSGPRGVNLLVNPYFEGEHSSITIPGWINSGHWDISVKPSNPSPQSTAARINIPAKFGETNPGDTATLYQIVQGGGSNLAASIACVEHYAEIMQVTILGSQSSGGPWTPVWQPFNLSICGFADWGPTMHAETQLPQAWAFYQFQIVGRFQDENGGVKITNASLSVE